jgi:Fic family protein
MKWNWQQDDWPKFSYDKSKLEALETQFLKSEGILLGAFKHLNEDDKNTLKIDIICNEAIKTSEIEGEYLNRDSVQSSIRRQFGLQADNRKSSPSEQGIAEMMVDLYQTFNAPLTHEKLFAWHKMVTSGRDDLTDIGRYRTHAEPMQVISGYYNKTKVHFEAPPSSAMTKEMGTFMNWFKDTAPAGNTPLPALTRSGMAHLYFVCIHPFEDGNGRIGRGISEKALAQTFGEPTLIALSHTIQKHRKDYYNELEYANKSNEITSWLVYFAKTILDAQTYTQTYIEFLIGKTKLYDRLRGKLNERQDKALARMFKEGPEGFAGGLSADNYLSITRTSRATATRDLNELVEMDALSKTGERRHTRYHLNIE